MDPLPSSNPTSQFTRSYSQHTCRRPNPEEETQVLETVKSLLNSLTKGGNYNNIKNQLVETIIRCPSTFVLKSLGSYVFDMAMVEDAYIGLARSCSGLFEEIPAFQSHESCGELISFERMFLSKCRMELGIASSVPYRLYVEGSICGRFIKIVRLLIEIYKYWIVNEETSQSIIQILKDPIFSIPSEKNFNAMEIFLSSTGKLDATEFSNRSLHAFDRILETSEENNGDNLFATLEKTLEELMLSQTETCEESLKRFAAEKETEKSVHEVLELEVKYNDEIKLRKEADDALVRKNEEIDALNRILDSHKEELDIIRLQAEALERQHEDELRLSKEKDVTVAIEGEITEKVRLDDGATPDQTTTMEKKRSKRARVPNRKYK